MEKLKVFISSKMMELRDVREPVAKALDDRGIEAWVYEAHAGARPEDVVETSLSEVEAADIYVGLFWQKYGEVTVQEYRHARALDKPCFVYIRYKDIQREKALEDFLEDEVYDLQRGVTYDYFDSAVELGQQVADNIMAWLVRRHREMTAEIQEARVSQDEIARLQAGVDRLQAASREPLPQGTPADYLAQQMRAWFETLGYRFESHEVRDEDHFEWIINVPARRGYDRILVRGIEGEAEISDVAALRQAVDEQKTDEGWLVAARRKSQAACDKVEKKENRDLFCYTFDELLDEQADFSGYLDWLEAEVKQRGIDRMYVPLACIKEEFDPVIKKRIGASRYDERNGWIDGYIDRWLDDPSKEHISILGEFGTGKTWFALHYAWTAAQRYREAKERGVERPRLPLVIPLRDYAKAVSVESLFSEFFFRKHEIPLPGYSAFEQLNRMGKLLLIFDGFDEMAARVDRQKMINNFWELGRVVVPGAKAILTCRTEHFPEAKEGRALLRAGLQASTAKLTGEPPQFEVLELEKFDDDQIRRVLSFRASPATVEQVMSNSQLLDLARRPVMTEFILEALSDIEAGKPVDLSRIYLYAVRRKMERDIKAERTFTSLADKLYFLCELSWEMLSTDQMSLNYRLFPDRLRRLFGPVVQEQKDLDHWHYDMMGQTMLIRNADGDYTPAHRSLIEFFVAYKFAAELGALASDFTELAQAQKHLDENAKPRKYKWSEYFRRERDENGEIVPIPPLARFVMNPTMEQLVEKGGMRFRASQAVLAFMTNMVEAEDLWNVVEATKGKNDKDIGYVGGNAITLLSMIDETVAGRNLENSVLIGAQFGLDPSGRFFRDLDLTRTNLRGANLREAFIPIKNNMSFANLSNSDLEGAEFGIPWLAYSLAFSPDGCYLALFSHLGPGLWKTGDANWVWTVSETPNAIGDVCFSPDSLTIAACFASAEIIIYDVKSGSCIKRIESEEDASADYIEFSPDGRYLACLGVIWDTSEWRKVHSFEWHQGYVRDACFASDGRYVISVSQQPKGKIVAWDLEAQKTVLSSDKPNSLFCCSIDSANELIAAAGGEATIWTWNTRDTTEYKSLKGHTSSVVSLRFSPDDRYLASGGADNRIVLWEISTGKIVHIFEQIGWGQSLEFSPDGTLLASVDRNTFRIWDLKTKECIHNINPGDSVLCRDLDLRGATGLDKMMLKWFEEQGATIR